MIKKDADDNSSDDDHDGYPYELTRDKVMEGHGRSWNSQMRLVDDIIYLFKYFS